MKKLPHTNLSDTTSIVLSKPKRTSTIHLSKSTINSPSACDVKAKSAISNYLAHYLRKKVIVMMTFFIALCSGVSVNGQIFLQLEQKNVPASKKIGVLQTLTFKLKEYPKDWRTQKIFEILPKENTIIFDENFFKPNEISHVQFKRHWTRSLGDKMMVFSSAYFLYGGVATVADSDFTMSSNQVVLGGAVATAGFLLRTLFYKRTIKLGKNFRLRIVDLRMREF